MNDTRRRLAALLAGGLTLFAGAGAKPARAEGISRLTAVATLKASEANESALEAAEKQRQALRRMKGTKGLVQDMNALIENLKTVQGELRKLKELAAGCQ